MSLSYKRKEGYKPLKFRQNDEHEKPEKCQSYTEIDLPMPIPIEGNMTAHSFTENVNSNAERKNEKLLKFLCQNFENSENLDSTEPSTPKSSKVFVDDTPVKYYGVSVIERRKRGLDF